MAKPSEFPGFKALLAEWNRRLVESGFKDIENDGVLPNPTGTHCRYRGLDPAIREAQARYFQIIQDKIDETEFDNPLDREILTLYAEGMSQSKIKKSLGIEGHRCKVYEPIYYWLKVWGLK